MLRNLKVIPIGGVPSELGLLDTLGNTEGKLVGFRIISNFSLPSETQSDHAKRLVVGVRY